MSSLLVLYSDDWLVRDVTDSHSDLAGGELSG